MSTMPAPASQREQFAQVQLAIDEVVDLGPVRDPAIYTGLDGSEPFGCPNDEYLAFGLMWWRYMTSGASTSSARSRGEAWKPRR